MVVRMGLLFLGLRVLRVDPMKVQTMSAELAGK
jgi:hypothetical protein